MVEFGARSQRFLEVIQDMIEGSQSYLGLAAKLHLGLAAALWDMRCKSSSPAACTPLRTAKRGHAFRLEKISCPLNPRNSFRRP